MWDFITGGAINQETKGLSRKKETMSCKINWNILSLEQWEAEFSKIRRSNLLQSYDYARAFCLLNKQRARWGVIEIDEQLAGLVQMFEAGALLNMLHACIIDRGPLWFEGFKTEENFRAFLNEWDRQFPNRIGRRRRIIPEIEKSDGVLQTLHQAKLQTAAGKMHDTIWIDLTQNENTLRGALKKNWRNILSRAERENLSVEWDDQAQHFPWLMKAYAIDRAQKDYPGPSLPLMKALAQQFTPKGKCWILRIIKDSQAVAAALVLLHGSSATYQIGWTSREGRSLGGQNLALWQAILRLKQHGYTDFDLGGVNDDTAKGVQTFKKGMGGDVVSMPDIYTG